jgi:hypothetical protein
MTTSITGRASSLLDRIPPHVFYLAVPAIIALQALILYAMGRVPICTCGTIKLWHGVVHSAENSQQILDWYSLTHVIHGFLFYFLLWLVLPRAPVALRLLLAVALEGGWELLENSDFIINRYRAGTISFDYFGDSIINSVSDTVMMMVGFALAYLLPAWSVVALAVVTEITLAYLIHDNFTLNVIMVLHPVEAIKAWQATAPLR